MGTQRVSSHYCDRVSEEPGADLGASIAQPRKHGMCRVVHSSETFKKSMRRIHFLRRKRMRMHASSPLSATVICERLKCYLFVQQRLCHLPLSSCGMTSTSYICFSSNWQIIHDEAILPPHVRCVTNLDSFLHVKESNH